MNDDHPFLADIPAYALGALDPDAAAALEAHLETCDSCRAELAAFRAVSDNLLLATPPQQPPAALRRRLQESLPSAQKEERMRRSWSFGKVALVAAFILLLGMNIFSFLQIRSLQNQLTQFTRQFQTAQTALAMLTYPETKSVPIEGQGIGGSVLVNQAHNVAVLVMWNLPPLADDQTYQVWLTDPNGKRSSAGWFRPQAGQAFTSQTVSSQLGLSNFVSVGVTLEPAGGSPQPTGDRIFKVDF